MRGKNDEIRLALCCLLTEGHLLLDDVPGTGKTSARQGDRRVDRRHLEARAVHARPAAQRHHRRDGVRPEQRHVLVPRGPGLHQRADRRRDQPWQPEDAVGAARGDGGAPGHRRRRAPPGAPAVLRHRHPEPARLPGHVPACPTSSSTDSRCASASATPTTRPRSACSRSTAASTSATSRCARSPTPTQLEQLIDVDRPDRGRAQRPRLHRPPRRTPPAPTPICGSAFDPRHALAAARRPRLRRHRAARLRDARRHEDDRERRVRPSHGAHTRSRATAAPGPITSSPTSSTRCRYPAPRGLTCSPGRASARCSAASCSPCSACGGGTRNWSSWPPRSG